MMLRQDILKAITVGARGDLKNLKVHALVKVSVKKDSLNEPFSSIEINTFGQCEGQEEYREPQVTISFHGGTSEWIGTFPELNKALLPSISKPNEKSPQDRDLKSGFVVVCELFGGGYEIGLCETGEDNVRKPVFFQTELEAQKEIADNKIMELQSFINGERDWEDTQFETDEFVAMGVLSDDGKIIVTELNHDNHLFEMTIQELN